MNAVFMYVPVRPSLPPQTFPWSAIGSRIAAASVRNCRSIGPEFPPPAGRPRTVRPVVDTLRRVTRYVDSEVGRLDTVLLHRPGPELARLTPRNNDSLLFDGIPWVGRAQEEHDIFAEALRARGTTVLYLGDLLVDVLAIEPARKELTEAVLADVRLGDSLRRRAGEQLADLAPAELAVALTAGVAHE